VGEPVLVLHGFPTASYDFSRVTPLLANNYQLILFDYPGFGFSDKPRSETYSLFRYADAAQAISMHFGLNQTLVLAHDIGDSVALELLQRNHPIVKKLILLNGSVLSIPLEDCRMLILQKFLLHPIGGPLMSRLGLFGKPLFANMFRKIFFERLPNEDIEAFWSLIKYNNGAAIYHLLIRYMFERWQYQNMWLDALEAYPVPLTLIWGQSDPVAPPSVADYVTKRRPDATYIRLEKVGHYPHWEAPLDVATSIWEAFG
jgi:pimeloyl-ACP methyl ester carboxylesterase